MRNWSSGEFDSVGSERMITVVNNHPEVTQWFFHPSNTLTRETIIDDDSTVPKVCDFLLFFFSRVSGGELFEHVCRQEKLSEAEAAAFIRQILSGVKHLHTRCIVHLDLKVLK